MEEQFKKKNKDDSLDDEYNAPDDNEMTFNMDDVERLGDEMEELSQNEHVPIDNDNYGADLEGTNSEKSHKKLEN